MLTNGCGQAGEMFLWGQGEPESSKDISHPNNLSMSSEGASEGLISSVSNSPFSYGCVVSDHSSSDQPFWLPSWPGQLCGNACGTSRTSHDPGAASSSWDVQEEPFPCPLSPLCPCITFQPRGGRKIPLNTPRAARTSVTEASKGHRG